MVELPKDYESKWLDHYKAVFEAQRKIFINQYDMEWHELQERIKCIINSQIQSYSIKILNLETVVTKQTQELRRHSYLL